MSSILRQYIYTYSRTTISDKVKQIKHLTYKPKHKKDFIFGMHFKMIHHTQKLKIYTLKSEAKERKLTHKLYVRYVHCTTS